MPTDYATFHMVVIQFFYEYTDEYPDVFEPLIFQLKKPN